MFKKIFKKESKEDPDKKIILIIALLIHAAKIDENYTDVEKDIIKKSVMELNSINSNKANELIKIAEGEEEKSNQIVEFTREIKKYSMDYRLKLIEIIWKIVYSDGTSDQYESNLIRRICGLLYVSDKDSGIIKQNVRNSLK